MGQLKRLIREIHRRSLWQVLLIYVGGAWVCYEIIDTITDRLLLPSWLPVLAIILFLIGLPIVLATAFVQEGIPARESETVAPSGETEEPVEAASGAREDRGLGRLFTWRNAIAGGVVALALWGVIAAGYLILGDPGSGPEEVAGSDVPPDRIAVLPFSYRGGEEFAYLGEGIVDLLSATLDGAGELNTVDARSVIRAVEGQGGRAPDPESGAGIARRLNAGKYVVGDIVEVGDRLRVNAFLQSVGGREPLSRAAVEGAADEVFELVDDLTAQLLVGAVEGGARQARLAAVTTDSLAALKAYLEGARHYRKQRHSESIEAFQRAVQIDPNFALAYRGLQSAAAWAERRNLQAEAGQHVQRLKSRLPERERRYLDAVATARDAWRLLPEYLESYPNDARAWYELGDLIFHYGPIKGRHFTEAKGPFERVLSLDPRDADALFHLAAVMAWEGRRERLDSLTRRVLVLAPEGEYTPALLALRAFALEDSSARRRLDDVVARANAGEIAGISKYIAVYSHDLEAAFEPARRMTGPSQPVAWRGYGHLLLGHLEAAKGRWRDAEREFERADALIPGHAIEYRAHLAVAPFLPAGVVDLDALRSGLAAWDAEVAPVSGVGSFLNATEGLHQQVRLYLLGLVSARLGLHEEALGYAAELESSEPPAAGRYLVPDFARTVRAQVALERGDPESSLELLAGLNLAPHYGGTYRSPFYTQLHTRFLLAEAHRAAGREDEALRWLASLGGTSSLALSYVAPAHLRRAEIHERRGETREAAHHYSRFVALWQDCDPELRPLVDDAERRLARLAGEPTAAR